MALDLKFWYSSCTVKQVVKLAAVAMAVALQVICRVSIIFISFLYVTAFNDHLSALLQVLYLSRRQGLPADIVDQGLEDNTPRVLYRLELVE